jgi:hypothetical protein
VTTVRWAILGTLVLGQMSCVSMQRDSRSGYQNYKEGDASEVSVYEKMINEQVRTGRKKSEVEVLESSIRTESEYEYYNEAKPVLKTMRDRKEFLTQKTRNQQKRWLASRGVSELSLYEPAVRAAIDNGDVALGMSKEAVLKSWGDPEAVEVAGNPDYGSERWVYTNYEPSQEGYQTQQRMVYFERGKVVGWETR